MGLVMKTRFFWLIVTLSVMFATNAKAAIISSSSDILAPTVIDFSQFAGTVTFTTGPVIIGGLVGSRLLPSPFPVPSWALVCPDCC
jgi:hypothetical protein